MTNWDWPSGRDRNRDRNRNLRAASTSQPPADLRRLQLDASDALDICAVEATPDVSLTDSMVTESAASVSNALRLLLT